MTRIWQRAVDVDALRSWCVDTMVDYLGIDFVEVGDDYMVARMPVDRHTMQGAGLLHGGASVVLAETLGSLAANFCVDIGEKICVGLAVDAHHIRSARSGFVYGRAEPIHIGTSTQLWQIRICDEQDRLVCISKLTLAVLDKR